MALSTAKNVLQKSPLPTRIISVLQNPLRIESSQNPNLPITLQRQSPNLYINPSKNLAFNVPPVVGSLTHLYPSMYFPISPTGHFSYPISSTGSIQGELKDDDSGMWADSVKKKRKKKMNKHKYQKLRKRFRRQT